MARTQRPSDDRPSAVLLDETAELDARFERRLDLWLSSYRVVTAGAAFVFVVILLPTVTWLLVLGAVYLAAGAAVFPALRLVGSS